VVGDRDDFNRGTVFLDLGQEFFGERLADVASPSRAMRIVSFINASLVMWSLAFIGRHFRCASRGV